jgi:hypothetical protein
MRIWGRRGGQTRPLEPIPREYWEDWEIPAASILLGDDPEPLSTTINEYSAKRWERYYDLHFNHREIWQLADVTDRMHGLLMERADALMGCTENSPEETELAALTDIIEAYQRQRWPAGRIPGGNG